MNKKINNKRKEQLLTNETFFFGGRVMVNTIRVVGIKYPSYARWNRKNNKPKREWE